METWLQNYQPVGPHLPYCLVEDPPCLTTHVWDPNLLSPPHLGPSLGLLNCPFVGPELNTYIKDSICLLTYRWDLLA